jgi:multicomponent Na+:H+ antiporter subunit D
VCQLGYMVVGIGIGSAIALNGAAAHAITNILFKGLLLMSVGSVIHMTGKYKLSELGGLYKSMPTALIMYMVGAFAISSVPFFNGFVSKSLIIEGVAQKEMAVVWAMIIIASAGTFLSVGLKLPYLAFFGKDSNIRVDERKVPKNMLFAMGLTAALCIFIGVFPNSLYLFLQHQPVSFNLYTPEHVFNEIAFLMFVALVFFIYIKDIKVVPTINLDVDWFYRKAGNFVLRIFNYQLSKFSKWTENVFLRLGAKSLWVSYNPATWFSMNVLKEDKKGEYPNVHFHMDIVGPTAMLTVLYLIIVAVSILWLWEGATWI